MTTAQLYYQRNAAAQIRNTDLSDDSEIQEYEMKIGNLYISNISLNFPVFNYEILIKIYKCMQIERTCIVFMSSFKLYQ